MFWLPMLILLILLVFVNRKKNRKITKLSNQLKSDTPRFPIAGHYFKFYGDGEVLMKAYQHFGKEAIKMGGRSSFWVFHQFFAVVADPADAQFILKNYLDKGFFMNFIRDLIGNGNFVAPETTLGTNLKIAKKLLHKGLAYVAVRMWSPWKYNGSLYKLYPSYRSFVDIKRLLKDLFLEIVAMKRIELLFKTTDIIQENQPKSFKTFLELLMEAKVGDKGYTDEEVQEETLVLFMAGSDTLPVALSFTALMLARHPDVQEKVFLELKEVLEDSTRTVSSEDLARMKYLEAVIKESMRLYPVVPVIVREADRELTLPSGVTIVPNCMMLINIWALHRHPHFWGPDAETFRPERWLETESPLKHPAQYMPFSYGPRNCVGQHYAMSAIKISLATLLLRYKISPDPKSTTDGALKPLRVKCAITMMDVDNFMVTLEKRTKFVP